MNNPWTPERELKLTKLWMAGHTRAQVAEALGPPVTESAVKGKVRRLGLKRDPSLSGRPVSDAKPNPATADAASPGPSRPAQLSNAAPKSVGKRATATSPSARSKAADAKVGTAKPLYGAAKISAERKAAADNSAAEIAARRLAKTETTPSLPPASNTANADEAGWAATGAEAYAAAGGFPNNGDREFRFPGYNECHWPHGEPDNPDFDFCLAPAAPGKSYCAEHAVLAYRKKGS